MPDSFGNIGKQLDGVATPKESNGFASLLSTASLGGKKINEDSCSSLINDQAQFTAMMVADGIGSYRHAAQASTRVVENLKESLGAITKLEELDFYSLFAQAQQRLMHAAPNDPHESDLPCRLGTTLTCVVETADELRCAYVGNGSIWHIRGSFLEINEKIRPIPWNATNYLNPHAALEGGKEALTRYLSNDDLPEHILTLLATPTVFSLQKDTINGDCIIITTDGIYSEDQIEFGLNGSRDLLFLSPPSLGMLFQHLRVLLRNPDIEVLSQTELDFFTENYLKALQSNKLLHDDATMGVLLTDAFLHHHHNKAG